MLSANLIPLFSPKFMCWSSEAYFIFVIHTTTAHYQSVLLLVEIVSLFHRKVHTHSSTSPNSAELLIFIRFPDPDALWRKFRLGFAQLSLIIFKSKFNF